ncbi:excitatory amino acid transporter 2-like isoform X1 [Crassostrea virginica]
MDHQRSKCYKFLFDNGLIITVSIGVALGFAFGLGLRHLTPSNDAITWIGLPGEIYMRLLKMMILPLVISTIITGTSSMDVRSNGRIGALSFGYIVITNSLGTLIGIVVFLIIQPGNDVTGFVSEENGTAQTDIETSDMFADMIRNLFPDNLITACFQKTQTKYSHDAKVVSVNGTNSSTSVVNKTVSTTGGVNILGLILASTLFGITASKLGKRVKAFTEFFETISFIIIRLLNWVIWVTPIGVASLIATALLKASDISSVFRSAGMYVLAHSIGIFFHMSLTPLAYFITTRKNPLRFLSACLRPWFTVFASTSTAIGIPEMLKTLDLKLHVDTRVSNLVVPLGAAMERMGSCVFIVVSALFLIQLEGISLPGSKILLIGLLTAAGSLAIPSVPSSSVVAVLIVLSSLDIQVHNIGIVFALEWYNDRIRSTSNTMTILVGAVILDRICKSSLTVPTNQQEETLNEPEPEVIVHINKRKDSTKEEKPLLMT